MRSRQVAMALPTILSRITTLNGMAAMLISAT
jgi:hypothetical protein